MGRKRGGHKKAGGGGVDPMDILGDLFRPLPPNKRHDLNKLVEKLLNASSNYSQDAVTPKQLWEEHLEIRALVEKVAATVFPVART